MLPPKCQKINFERIISYAKKKKSTKPWDADFTNHREYVECDDNTLDYLQKSNTFTEYTHGVYVYIYVANKTKAS